MSSSAPVETSGLRSRSRGLEATRSEAPPTVRRRAVGIAVARLVVATLLLGGTFLVAGGDASAPSAQIALGLIVAAYVGSIAAALALERGSPERVAVAQVALDLVLTSGLCFVTDGAHSGFASLYAVVVLASALVLGARAALVTTGAALVLYLGLGLSAANGWIPIPPDRLAISYFHSASELALSVLRTSVGLIAVGGLSAGLADRLLRARRDAMRAAERAAGYEKLADDIVRSISAGLVTTDPAGVIESANAQAAVILGREELLGEEAASVLPLETSAASGRSQRGEGDVVRGDGSTVPVGFTRTALVDATGRAHGSLVLFSDLSELRELRFKAERAERLATIGHLAVGLAHEIRNPLGAISGSVELVRDGANLGAEDRRLLELVLSETNRLNELVGTMLQIGRPSLPERVDVDLAALVRDVVLVLGKDEALALRGVSVRADAEAPVTVPIDPSQLRQVVWNLVKNAVQVSPKGGEVVARVQATDEGAVIEVTDRGPGIAAADRERLFDAFFTRRPEGVGLGLALVRQIVDAHAGRIDIESEIGRGTTFRIGLPTRTSTPEPTPTSGPT